MITIRMANLNDIDTYFNWANEDVVRKLSYNSEKISYSEHKIWFNNNLNDENCFLYLFSEVKELGQVRIQKISGRDAIISISIDEKYRGRGLGVKMLFMAIEKFKNIYPELIINAYIKIENIASKKIFEKTGFFLKGELIYKNIKSLHYIYENKTL